ncbi:hypothetical protein PRO82_001882 [Candidatus Protochlamydia amoebophila]|nr:hypothetical protein [Candidatus Protochlamydia amoebophila]
MYWISTLKKFDLAIDFSAIRLVGLFFEAEPFYMRI